MIESKMVTMESGSLEGSHLAYCVAKALGHRVEREDPRLRSWVYWDSADVPHSFGRFGFRPDTDWEQGGPIVDKHVAMANHAVGGPAGGEWAVSVKSEDGAGHGAFGATLLIAAMRALVASKFGRKVEVPEVLVEL